MCSARVSPRVLALLAGLAGAACSSATAPRPQFSDPAQLSADLQTISGLFAAGPFQSFSGLATASGSPLAAPSLPGTLLAAAPIAPPRDRAGPYADAPARLQALRRAAAALPGPAATGVIPDTLWGRTYVWQSGSGYVVGPDPGPPNGIRIMLYAVDPLTGQIVEPPVAVGYVDLLDESTAATSALHVVVRGGTPASPGTAYADYVVTATVSGTPVTGFTATATGFVSDGTRTLSFNAGFSATNLTTDNPDAQIDVAWDSSSPAVHLELHETLATPDATHANLAITFSVTRGGETVSVAGTVLVVTSPQSLTADLTVAINGQTFARITGTATASANTIRIVHADGTPLSAQELAVVQALFDLPDRMQAAVEALFHPAEHLMGA
jgi:hypothetical protein